MKRLHMLRNRALNQTFSLGRYQYLFWKSFEKNHIYKNAYRDMMTQLTPLISEGELIVGSYGEPMSPEESTEWENRYLPLFQKTTAHVGQDSHMAIDYELVLHCGLSGIINKIEKNLKSCKTESVSFYEKFRRTFFCKLRITCMYMHCFQNAL